MIEYRHNVPLDPQEVTRVFEASGLLRPVKNIARITRMLEGANLITNR